MHFVLLRAIVLCILDPLSFPDTPVKFCAMLKPLDARVSVTGHSVCNFIFPWLFRAVYYTFSSFLQAHSCVSWLKNLFMFFCLSRHNQLSRCVYVIPSIISQVYEESRSSNAIQSTSRGWVWSCELASHSASPKILKLWAAVREVFATTWSLSAN